MLYIITAFIYGCKYDNINVSTKKRQIKMIMIITPAANLESKRETTSTKLIPGICYYYYRPS